MRPFFEVDSSSFYSYAELLIFYFFMIFYFVILFLLLLLLIRLIPLAIRMRQFFASFKDRIANGTYFRVMADLLVSRKEIVTLMRKKKVEHKLLITVKSQM